MPAVPTPADVLGYDIRGTMFPTQGRCVQYVQNARRDLSDRVSVGGHRADPRAPTHTPANGIVSRTTLARVDEIREQHLALSDPDSAPGQSPTTCRR